MTFTEMEFRKASLQDYGSSKGLRTVTSGKQSVYQFMADDNYFGNIYSIKSNKLSKYSDKKPYSDSQQTPPDSTNKSVQLKNNIINNNNNIGIKKPIAYIISPCKQRDRITPVAASIKPQQQQQQQQQQQHLFQSSPNSSQLIKSYQHHHQPPSVLLQSHTQYNSQQHSTPPSPLSLQQYPYPYQTSSYYNNQSQHQQNHNNMVNIVPQQQQQQQQQQHQMQQQHRQQQQQPTIIPPQLLLRKKSEGFVTPIESNPQEVKGSGAAGSLLVVIQIFLLICFFLFVSYDPENVDARRVRKGQSGVNQFQEGSKDLETSSENILPKLYPMFQDVHVMIFIGFGFLMTFLRKYGYSAVGYNMLIAAIAIQWSILCRGLFHHEGGQIPINIESLINGDFAAAAVLITFGAVLGVTNPLQLITLCMVEVFLYALNEYIGTELLKAVDVGGSIFIHTFGAYFGLALSLTMRRQSELSCEKEAASYTSDVFAMIGTVFLWLFWPSFNGALAVGDHQHRAVLNTVLSLTGSCIFSFAMSALLNHENKFNMVHVQNASLAGGVAVGSVADLMIRPFGALLIGSLAGILSTVGYVYLTPLLQRKLGLHDTCGVHNLHGMPGVLAGIFGVIMASFASESDYGKSLYLQYPARAPFENTSDLSEFRNNDLVGIEPGLNRSASQQAMYQLMALGITMGIAIVGGALTGLLLRIPIFGKVANDGLFDDSKLWEVPEDEESVGKANPNAEGISNQTFEIATREKDSEF